MTFLLKVIGISCLIEALAAVGPEQIDPKNVPKPPTAELKKFEPFWVRTVTQWIMPDSK
jgi:hypothetical protein